MCLEDTSLNSQQRKIDLHKLYQGLRRKPDLERPKIISNFTIDEKLKNSFVYKKFLRVLTIKKLNKKRVRFLKNVKLKILRKLKRLIFRKYKVHFVAYFLRKYYTKWTNRTITALLLKRCRENKFNLKRFSTRLRFNYKPNVLGLIRKSVSLARSEPKNLDQSRQPLGANLSFSLTKKLFRNKLPFLDKMTSILSKKGNNKFIYLKLSNEIKRNRSAIFAGIRIFAKNFSFSQKFITGKNYYLPIISYKLSVSLLFRRILGMFYKIRINSLSLAKTPNKNISIKLFILSRLKKLSLVSSIRRISKVLKPFYLHFDIRAWKKSGRSLLVPVPIKSENRRAFLFSHWVKDSTLLRSEPFVSQKIVGELVDVGFRRGLTIKKLSMVYKMVKANRAMIRKSKISLF